MLYIPVCGWRGKEARSGVRRVLTGTGKQTMINTSMGQVNRVCVGNWGRQKFPDRAAVRWTQLFGRKTEIRANIVIKTQIAYANRNTIRFDRSSLPFSVLISRL